ncbi:MAG TPA: hypothetical protein PK599_02135 [bacterium]|nr:hypothetical protein [bacterium]
MKNKIIFFVMTIAIAMIAGCRVEIPEDAADYTARLHDGAFKFISVKIPISIPEDDKNAILMRNLVDFQSFLSRSESFSLVAEVSFDGNNKHKLDISCGYLPSDMTMNCNIFSPSLRFSPKVPDLAEAKTVKIVFTISGNSCAAIAESGGACEYATPELDIISVVAVTSKIPDGIIPDASLKRKPDSFSKEDLDGVRHANMEKICKANPEFCGLKDTDIEDDNKKLEDALVLDDNDDDDFEAPNLMGEGGACTMLPGSSGGSVAGLIMMICAIVPVVFRRKLK